MSVIRIFILFSMLFFSAPVLAVNGNDLLNSCETAVSYGTSGTITDPSDAFIAGYCYGSVVGSWGTSLAYEFAYEYKSKQKGLLFCPPKADVSKEQLVRVVVKYLSDHPEKLHLGEFVLIREAFQGAFPCD